MTTILNYPRLNHNAAAGTCACWVRHNTQRYSCARRPGDMVQGKQFCKQHAAEARAWLDKVDALIAEREGGAHD